MRFPVLVETLDRDHFRAEAPHPFNLTAEGKSLDEAAQNLRAQISAQLSSGKQIVLLEIPLSDENPWIKYAGHLKDDTFLDDWKAGLEEYRRQRDLIDDDFLQAQPTP